MDAQPHNANIPADAQRRIRVQTQLNLHPDASPFWDTPDGQDILHEAAAMKLKATNTNKERCAIYAEAKRLAMVAA